MADVGFGAVEGSGVGEFDCTHGGGEFTCLNVVGTTAPAVEIACHVGVATTCRVNHVGRGVGGNVVEFAVGIYQRTSVAKRQQNLAASPCGKPTCRFAWVRGVGQRLHLLLIRLQNIDIF